MYQPENLAMHNATLKILFFEMLKGLELISEMPPWHSKTQPKLLYENESVQALWDVPVYADSIEVRANRIDSRIVDKEQKQVLAITEMSCAWLDNCEVRDMEKTQKYGPLMWELRERNPSYQVNQCNIIIDVLGGYSADVSHALKEDQIHLTLCVVSKFLLQQRGLLLKCSSFFRKKLLWYTEIFIETFGMICHKSLSWIE